MSFEADRLLPLNAYLTDKNKSDNNFNDDDNFNDDVSDDTDDILYVWTKL